MTIRERAVLLTVLLSIFALVAFDLVIDSSEGVAVWHLLTEGAVGLVALLGAFYLLKDGFALRQHLKQERALSLELRREAEDWRNRSRKYLQGLSASIDEQLTEWKLTPSEKDVAFLLIKVMSLKDIAHILETSEKTARVQATAIYAKAGLSGRPELAAFFLEELLQPDHALGESE